MTEARRKLAAIDGWLAAAETGSTSSVQAASESHATLADQLRGFRQDASAALDEAANSATPSGALDAFDQNQQLGWQQVDADYAYTNCDLLPPPEQAACVSDGHGGWLGDGSPTEPNPTAPPPTGFPCR